MGGDHTSITLAERHTDVLHIRTTTLLLFWTVIPATVDAQEPTATRPTEKVSTVSNRLSMQDAIESVLRNHPELRSASAAIQQQQHLVYQSTRKPNPTIGYTAAEVGNEGEAGQQGLFLSQNIVRGCKLELNGRVQQQAVSEATQNYLLRQSQIEAQTRLAFLEVAVAQEKQKVLRRLRTSLEQARKSSLRLLESGLIGQSSVSQGTIEVQKNEMQLQKTLLQLQIARSNLAALTGISDLPDEIEAAVLKPNSGVPEFDAAWNQIEQFSPELKVLSARLAGRQWKVRREVAEPVPDLQTQWTLQQDAATNHTVVGVQLGVELPVRNTNAGAINAARADTRRVHHDIHSLRRSLRQRLVIAHGRMLQADQQLAFIREHLEVLTRENLQKTQQAFAVGEAGYLDLLNAQRSYINLSLDKLSLYRDRAIGEAHLQTALVMAPTSASE